MSSLAAPAADGLFALGERKRVLDAVWLLTLFVVLLAVAVPWYLRILEIDLAPVAWGTFAFAGLYVAGARLAERLESRRAMLAAVTAAQLSGVVFLAVFWHLAGGLQNPMLLLAFVLPVAAVGIMLASWQPYLSALVAVVAVAAVAFAQSPDLRWYVVQVGLPVEGLVGLLPERPPGAAEPFPSLGAPPSYLALLLALFSLLIVTAAVVSESLAAVVLRLYGRLQRTAAAREEAESLAEAVLRASPLPAALVYADTGQVLSVSENFEERLLLTSGEAPGRDFLEVAGFSYPEVIAERLREEGGEVPFATYRVGAETRVARVRISRLHHGEERYAHVSLEDVSDLSYLRAAVDALDEPLLLLGVGGRVVYLNRSARGLFAGAEVGDDAAAALEDGDLPAGWWDLGPRDRQERALALAGRPWRARCVAAHIPGERQRLTAIALRPEERA